MRVMIAVGLVVVGSPSSAGAPIREVIPARGIERALELADGWSSVEAGLTLRRADALRDPDGGRVRLDDRWREREVRVGWRYGASRRIEVGLVASALVSASGSTGWHAGPGALTASVRGALVDRDAPRRSVVLDVGVQATPARRGAALGGVPEEGVPVAGPTPLAASVGVAAKLETAPLAWTGSLGARVRVPGPIAAVDDPSSRTLASGGHAVQARGGAAVQLGPAQPWTELDATWTAPLALGTASPGAPREVLEGSSGLAAGLRVGLDLHALRTLDLRFFADRQLLGHGPGLAPVAGAGALVERGVGVELVGRTPVRRAQTP